MISGSDLEFKGSGQTGGRGAHPCDVAAGVEAQALVRTAVRGLRLDSDWPTAGAHVALVLSSIGSTSLNLRCRALLAWIADDDLPEVAWLDTSGLKAGRPGAEWVRDVCCDGPVNLGLLAALPLSAALAGPLGELSTVALPYWAGVWQALGSLSAVGEHSATTTVYCVDPLSCRRLHPYVSG